MTRVARRAWIDVGNINWHPLTGTRADAVGGSWNGKVIVDLPYFNRTSKAPPSHYTICAKYNPLAPAYPSPHMTLMLSESVTVMGEDQYGKPVQFDFIAAIWPGVNYSAFGAKWNGDMTNGHWSGGSWVARTQSDGQQDNGVTCEEWDTGIFFHSNTHRVPPGEYQPPLPSLGHVIMPPTIFGYSGGDKHIYAVWGLYDCRAEDIPADPRYAPLTDGDIKLTINASYDILTGADIRSGGNPIPYEVRAKVVPAPGYIADTPYGGNFPAAFMVAADSGIVANVSYLAPALDPTAANNTVVVTGGVYSPVDGIELSDGQSSVSSTVRGQTLVVESASVPGDVDAPSTSAPPSGWGGMYSAPAVAADRGYIIQVSVPINYGSTSHSLTVYNLSGTLHFYDEYGHEVDAVDGSRGRTERVSAPTVGQVLQLAINAEGTFTVNEAVLLDTNGEVMTFAMNKQIEDPTVVIDVPAEDPPDPTDTPDDTEIEGSSLSGAGDPEDDDGDTSNWGNGGGSNWGNGPGDFSGGGGGEDGGDGMGGDADI